MIKNKWPEPHETQEKLIKKKLHVMSSAGQYRSTEKVWQIIVSESIWKYYILKFKDWIFKIFVIHFRPFPMDKKIVKKTEV